MTYFELYLTLHNHFVSQSKQSYPQPVDNLWITFSTGGKGVLTCG